MAGTSTLRRWATSAALLGVWLATGCFSRTNWEPHLTAVTAIPDNLPPRTVLKVHLASGEVILADTWNADEPAGIMDITGRRYTVARDAFDVGNYRVAFDSIALIEWRSREVRRPAGLTVLPVLTTLYGAITVACVADPKSCFGSCPTFYVDGMSNGDRPLAEGFSASFAKALEARDVDALHGVQPDGDGHVGITMRNEALETHAVRHVRILAVPRAADERIYATGDGRFYRSRQTVSAIGCRASEGSCLDEVMALDGLERRVPTDPTDLATRETVVLTFPTAAGPIGLVLGARQAFVATFVFYQTIAYLGNSAGDFLASLERSGATLAPRATGMAELLGAIEVAVLQPNGTWQSVGEFDEAGPIATDVQLLPLGEHAPSTRDSVTIRLRMAQGNWRLDYVALATLNGEANPEMLSPTAVLRDGRPDSIAAARLEDPYGYLVTYPGDTYRLVFTLPDDIERADVFLDTQGYYYEWSRPEWRAEEDLALASLAFMDPAAMLRHLAPRFKQLEPRIEELFWSSRFGTER